MSSDDVAAETSTQEAIDHPPESTKRHSRLSVLLVALIALTLIATGGYGLWQRHAATSGRPVLPDATSVVTIVDPHPSEKAPTTDQQASYTVPANQPRSITIASIGASGLVQKVGTTKDNAVGTPNNVNFAGWYNTSSLPGSNGLSIIDGHVSGKYADGIFKKLANIKTGDIVQVEFGDKTVKKFMVIEIKQLPEANAAAFLFEKHPGLTSQLNLITCGGTFDRTTQQYANRVVVVTKPV